MTSIVRVTAVGHAVEVTETFGGDPPFVTAVHPGTAQTFHVWDNKIITVREVQAARKPQDAGRM